MTYLHLVSRDIRTTSNQTKKTKYTKQKTDTNRIKEGETIGVELEGEGASGDGQCGGTPRPPSLSGGLTDERPQSRDVLTDAGTGARRFSTAELHQ